MDDDDVLVPSGCSACASPHEYTLREDQWGHGEVRLAIGLGGDRERRRKERKGAKGRRGRRRRREKRGGKQAGKQRGGESGERKQRKQREEEDGGEEEERSDNLQAMTPSKTSKLKLAREWKMDALD